MKAQGCQDVPSPSAITRALHRHDLIAPADSYAHRKVQRFEHPAPNDLWQMDFKGHFPLLGGGRCHPLTVLDDHMAPRPGAGGLRQRDVPRRCAGI